MLESDGAAADEPAGRAQSPRVGTAPPDGLICQAVRPVTLFLRGHAALIAVVVDENDGAVRAGDASPGEGSTSSSPVHPVRLSLERRT
jgi:hypothetical protein